MHNVFDMFALKSLDRSACNVQELTCSQGLCAKLTWDLHSVYIIQVKQSSGTNCAFEIRC